MWQSKTWLITGASRGLGLSIARLAAQSGDNLVVCARGGDDLQSAVRTLTALGGQVEPLVGDVAQSSFREQLIRTAVQGFGRVDVLINNASILGPSPQPDLDAYPVDTLASVYDVNVLAPLHLIQLALPEMRKAGSGVIINITSDAAVAGYNGWGGYGSSKAALELLTKTLANELEGTGIPVFAVDPGDMRTQMHQEAFPGEDISDRPSPAGAALAITGLARHPCAVSGWRQQAGDLITAVSTGTESSESNGGMRQ